MHLPVAITTKDHRAPCDGARSIIARITHLRGVADVNPTLIEDGPLLARKDLARHEHLAINREGEVFAALAHQRSAIAVMACGTGALTGMMIVHGGDS